MVVSADDPAMHSSQDEQDNRNYAKFAKMAMVEPSDADEALQYVKVAYDISQRFHTSVLFRTTTRTSHAQGVARLGERMEPPKPLDEARARQLQAADDAAQRHPAAPRGGAAAARPRRVRRDHRAQPRRDGRHPRRHRRLRRGLRLCPRGRPGRQLPQDRSELAAAQAARRGLPRQGRQAVRGRGARPVPGGEHPPAGRAGRRRQGHPAAVRRVQPGPGRQGAARSRRPRRGREPHAR